MTTRLRPRYPRYPMRKIKRRKVIVKGPTPQEVRASWAWAGLTVTELRTVAASMGLKGYSKATKEQLFDMIVGAGS